MANTLKIKRGTNATTPQGQLAEPLFTTDTYDLYIGKGGALGNQRFQKYIASGTSSQFLKGDGTLDSTTYQPTSEKGQNNGYASLDAGGKIPAAQLPSSVIEYKGTWNANTNTPTLADGTGDAGDVYIVSVGGTQNLGSGAITFAAGDWVMYNGSVWQKSTGSNAVASVNGQTGVVTITFDQLSPMTTLGDIIYGGASGAGTRLAGNTLASKRFITQTGDGTNSAAPSWGSIAAGDVPTLNQNTTGSAATLTTARTLTIGATGKTFDGSANVSWSLAEIGAEPTLTKGNLTETTSSVLTITGGTGAVIGSGTTIAVASAGAAQAGVVTTGTQTIAGAKTFSSDLTINGVEVGRGAGNDSSNTVFGYDVMNGSSTSVAGNTAIGYSAMNANTSGYGNTALGFGSLNTNTTGQSNTAIGLNAGQLIIGSYNTFVGRQAFSQATSGSNNTIIGYAAGLDITSGSNNTLIGGYTGPASALSGNVIISDGSGNIRFLHNGTNGKLPFLTSNGFVKTSGGDGTLEVSSLRQIASGALVLNSPNDTFPTTISDLEGRILIKSAVDNPTIILWGQNAFGSGNELSLLFLGNTSALGTNNASGAYLFGGIQNNTDGKGFFRLRTSNASGAETDAIYVDGTQNTTFYGNIIKNGGTSSQFLKADGSIDSSTYLTTSSASSTYLPLTGGTLTGALIGTTASFTSNSGNFNLGSQTDTAIYTHFGSKSASGGQAVAMRLAGTLTATANFDNLFGLWVDYTDNAAGYTGVVRYGIYQNDSGKRNYFGGPTTFNSAVTVADTATATAFIPTGTSVPSRGMYTSASNVLDFSAGTTNLLSLNYNTGLSTFNTGVKGSYFRIVNVSTAEFGINTENNQGYIGTTTSHGFNIMTNNTPRLTISSTGAATFSSTVTSNANAVGSFIASGNAASGIAGNIRFNDTGTTNSRDWLIGNAQGSGDYGDLAFVVGSSQNASPSLTRMIIKGAGNVIIGNNTAYGGLTISDFTANDGNDSLSFFYKGTTGGHQSLIKFYDFRGQLNAAIGNNLEDDGIGTQKASLVFKTSNNATPAEHMRITSGGKVGIGWDSPPSPLSVRWNRSSLFAGISVYDSQAYNASNHGGTVAFGGTYNSSNTYTEWSAIGGNKQNTTDGNISGNVILFTRHDGSAMTARFGVSSIGEVSNTMASGNAFFKHNGSITISGSGGTQTIDVTNGSLVFISENNLGTGALFFCGWSSSTVVLLADPSGIFAASDTANRICLYKSASTSTATIKNNRTNTNFTVYQIQNSD